MIKIKVVWLLLVFFLLPFFTSAQNFGGIAPSIKWRQLQFTKGKIIFPVGLDSQARRIATIMQLLDTGTAYSIGGTQKKWNVVLQNQTTVPNAYVRMAPKVSELYMTPPQNSFLLGSLRWDDNLMIHENRHVQQFSNFNKGFTKVFSFFLGQEGQLFANGLMLPDYFFEGDAVYQETLVSAQGRGRMPAFYNTFKSIWETNKKYNWWKYRSGSLKHLVPDHYQVGYLLTAYGYEKFGPDFWSKVTDDAVRFKRVFNKAIQQHSGVPFKQFRWDAINHFKQQALQSSGSSHNYITQPQKNNIVNYEFPQYLQDGSIIVTKQSNKKISAFYIIDKNGVEQKIATKKITTDEYFNCNDNTIVYASYQTDPRYVSRDYSVINVVDIKSGKQKQLTKKSKYFSPSINTAGTQIVAVKTKPNGSNNLVVLNAITGTELTVVANRLNYFYTYPKFLNDKEIIVAARNPQGNMCLAKVAIATGIVDALTNFTWNVIGYPFVKNDTVYYSRMDDGADRIFAIDLKNNRTYQLTQNTNGIYAPSVNNQGTIVYSAFTANGMQLATQNVSDLSWEQGLRKGKIPVVSNYIEKALKYRGERILETVAPQNMASTPYKKGAHLFNFHSWRAFAEDPEFGYTFFSDNILSNFKNSLTYTYNRTDLSHTVGYSGVYAGWFPLLSMGAEHSFNRTIDTAVGKSLVYNSATFKSGISIPLSFIGGRSNKFFNVGAGYNVETYLYNGVSKNVFKNKALNYVNTFLTFSNVGRRALQNINPQWAQAISLSYRDAFTFRNSFKFTANASLYFPGLFANHSLVINGSYQKRDTLPDLFSKSFSYARGYEALSTRSMYKWGVNYNLPLFYPDGGIPGLLYVQRIRTNLFYDDNTATARLNGVLTNVKSRSAGTEIYFDTKVWNSLPVTFGIRYARLLDTDLLNTGVKNRWEIVLPVGLIPE
jgi:hypothetical protein